MSYELWEFTPATKQFSLVGPFSEEQGRQGLSISRKEGVIGIEINKQYLVGNRSIYLHFFPGGRILMTGPEDIADSVFFDFVLKKQRVFLRVQKMKANNVHWNSLSFETGDVLLYRGKHLPLRVLPDRKKSLTVGATEITMCIDLAMSAEQRRQYYKKQMRQRLKRILTERLAYWEPRMGLYRKELHVRECKGQWGSCAKSKGSLSFNLHLIEAEPQVLDCIVVHELAHLRYPNHRQEFWKLVYQYIPEYEQLRKPLEEMIDIENENYTLVKRLR